MLRVRTVLSTQNYRARETRVPKLAMRSLPARRNREPMKTRTAPRQTRKFFRHLGRNPHLLEKLSQQFLRRHPAEIQQHPASSAPLTFVALPSA